MEELLKLANKTKEEHPSLLFDVDSIVEECKYWMVQGRNEALETSTAMDIISDLVKQLEKYDS